MPTAAQIRERLGNSWRLLGTYPDEIAAILLGCSKATALAYRSILGVPAFEREESPIAPDLADQMTRWLKSGRTMGWVHRHAGGITRQQVTIFARSIGWEWSWLPRRNAPTVGTLPLATVLRRARTNESLTSIASAAGVSRERIRQIVAREGLPPRRELAQRRSEQRLRDRKRLLLDNQRRRARQRRETARRAKKRLRSYLVPARALWAKGVILEKIAKSYGISVNSMAWWIHRGRRDLGWFPHRRIKAVRKRKAREIQSQGGTP